jgi:hypothetical protein
LIDNRPASRASIDAAVDRFKSLALVAEGEVAAAIRASVVTGKKTNSTTENRAQQHRISGNKLRSIVYFAQKSFCLFGLS